MLKFVLIRLVQAMVAIVIASFVLFIAGRLTGNPVDMILPLEATPAEREALIIREGLDRHVLYQYWIYVKGVVRGDFGDSLRTRRPVTELVPNRLYNSFRLASAAVLFAVLLGFPLGILAAVKHGGLWDRAAMVITLVGQSVPTFWTGIVAVLIFSVHLGWFPTSGIGGWDHFVLPAIILGWFASAGVVRLLRSSMLEVADSEYMKLARLKGVPEYKVVLKHSLRNALIPVVTFIGLMYGVIVGATITIEVVFAWPGFGRLAYEAVIWRDFPLLQFTVLVWIALIIAFNFVVDLLYVVLDPRIRV